MVQALLGSVIEDCPDIILSDNSSYSDVSSNGTYIIHDFLVSVINNSAYTIYDITVDGVDILNKEIEVFITSTGGIYNPHVVYMDIVDSINFNGTEYYAELNDSDLNYKNWYINIYSIGSSNNGKVVDSVSDFTPIMSDMSGGVDIESRNIALYDKDGNELDLGAIRKEDEITLVKEFYNAGDVFTINYCGDAAVYSVSKNNESDECVAKAISDSINSSSGKFDNIRSEHEGNKVFVESKISGVPFTISVTTSNLIDEEYVLHSVVTPNQSSMELPSKDSLNEIRYTTKERGGEYKAVLTIVSGCDYSQNEVSFFNWCFDLTSFDCCFASLTEKSCCNGCDESNVVKASKLRNIIKAINLMKDDSYDNNRIQKVVDCGWTICEPENCGGCGGCA